MRNLATRQFVYVAYVAYVANVANVAYVAYGREILAL